MEHLEHETIDRLSQKNSLLRRLYQRHKVLKEQLSDLEKRRFLTPEEEVAKLKIKKMKLAGKDRMMRLVAELAMPM